MSARFLRRVLEEQNKQQAGFIDEEPEPVVVDELRFSRLSGHQNSFSLLCDQDVDHDISESVPIKFLIKENDMSNSSSDVSLLHNHKFKKKHKREIASSAKSKSKEADKSLDPTLDLSIGSCHQSACLKSKSFSDSKCSDSVSMQQEYSVLAINPVFLQERNELKNIFGSKVLSSFKNNSNSRSRTTPGGRCGCHGHRKTILVSPATHWPRWDGTLSMELLETKDGKNFFRYVQSPSYEQAQNAFAAANATHDVNAIANVLTYHPYHIQSLFTTAVALKLSGDHQSSSEFLGRCLYALECAWHPSFTPLQGNCQLKCNQDTNKPFFAVLFTHMQNMNRRGCHRSALEVCKLLLSLDSEDPMGAIFCIDSFALRAEEYAWLQRFADEYRSDNSLWPFPNFSYSLAVSHFYLERDGSLSEEKASAVDLMKQALMLHPLVLKKLVDKVPMKEAIWTELLKHVFFGAAKAGSPSLDHLINIYVEQNYLLWRLPELQKLLKEAALLVIDSLNVGGNEARDWDCVKKEAFSQDKNEYAHLLVSDFSDSLIAMPPDELWDMMRDQHIAETIRNVVLLPSDGEGTMPDLHNQNTLMLLLEGLVVPLTSMRTSADAG